MNDQTVCFNYPIRALNWNVRGLGDSQKCDVIKDIAIDANPDLISYQETKWSECSIFRVRQVCPAKFINFLTLDAIGTRGGILLAWSSRFCLIDSYTFNYSVTAVLKTNNFKFMYTVVYGPQDDRIKIEFLQELQSVRELNNLPWLLMGDFNLYRNIEDTTGNIRNLGLLAAFNSFISNTNLLEVPLQGKEFTWSNKRPTPTFSKLDRTFISCHWNTLGTTHTLHDLPTCASDHTPLVLNIKPHINPQRKNFRFETFWLKHQEIHDVVATAWQAPTGSTNPVRNFNQKIGTVQKALTRWARQKFCSRDTYLRRSKWVLRQLDRVEELRHLNSIEFRLRIRLREHIFTLARDKELRWKQRSGCTWLKAGDKNTKYFHAVANGRKNRNLMAGLSREDGTPIPDVQLPQHTYNHFSTLLGVGPIHRRPFNLTGRVGPSLAQDLTNLDAHITNIEVLRAINEMPNDKASGPDGLPIEFYRSFWNIIKTDYMALILDFHNSGRNLKSINRASISLIPKKETPITISDYRPISVINTSVKIITKILANRLQIHLPQLIAQNQTAFIKGRSMMESFLVAREFLTFCSTRKLPAILYKVDFEKAFDTVDWCFLTNLLIERGFPPK